MVGGNRHFDKDETASLIATDLNKHFIPKTFTLYTVMHI